MMELTITQKQVKIPKSDKDATGTAIEYTVSNGEKYRLITIKKDFTVQSDYTLQWQNAGQWHNIGAFFDTFQEGATQSPNIILDYIAERPLREEYAEKFLKTIDTVCGAMEKIKQIERGY